MAKLYFRYGAMGCGKTAALLQVDYNYREDKKMKTYIIKPKKDTKGNKYVISRIGIKKKVDFLIDSDTDLYHIINQIEYLDCLLVDEAQFLTAKQVDELFQIAVMLDIPVICYGIRTDFKLNGFEGSQRLLLLSHSIEEIKTICRCGQKAVVSARKINNKFIFDGEQVLIDQKHKEVKYEALCASCYFILKEIKE